MPLRLLALLIMLVALAGCGGDDDGPTVQPPPTDTGLLVPEDYPTLYDALAAAGPTDEVSLAPGVYTVDASIERGVTVRRRQHVEGEVRLVDSRLVVRAPAGDHVVLEGLTMVGGDTLISVPGGADVTLSGCRLARAVLGILHPVSGDLELADCDLDSLGPGGALVVGGAARLSFIGGNVRACEADQAVIDLRDEVWAGISQVNFVDCPRYTIRQRGVTMSVGRCTFVRATGPSLVVGAGSRGDVDDCTFVDSVWPVAEVGGDLTLDPVVIARGLGDGPAVQVNPGGDLFLGNVTVHDGAGPAVAMAAGATVSVYRSLLTSLAVPVVAGPGVTSATLEFDEVDAWVPGLSAWAGLEDLRDAGAGNLEVDPLYCGAADLRLQVGSPVAGWGGLPVGCD